MTKFKNSNETSWVIFKQCAAIQKTQKKTAFHTIVKKDDFKSDTYQRRKIGLKYFSRVIFFTSSRKYSLAPRTLFFTAKASQSLPTTAVMKMHKEKFRLVCFCACSCRATTKINGFIPKITRLYRTKNLLGQLNSNF